MQKSFILAEDFEKKHIEKLCELYDIDQVDAKES